jgi:hypothetical protein
LEEGRRLIQADVGEWNKGGSSAHRWGQTTAWLVFEDGGGREKVGVANALVARWYRSRCVACPPEFDSSLGRLGCLRIFWQPICCVERAVSVGEFLHDLLVLLVLSKKKRRWVFFSGGRHRQGMRGGSLGD